MSADPASGSSTARPPILQPGCGPIQGQHYLPADPDTVLWGRLPCASDEPILTVHSGERITIDTVSHEGILPDQGSDPTHWFGAHGVAADEVLTDAVAITAAARRDPDVDGPHVVNRPIAVAGAEPGDLVAITVVSALPRVPYGVISNRHGRGALPAELPRGGATVSVFSDVVAEADRAGPDWAGPDWADGDYGLLYGRIPLTEGGPPVVRFPLTPFPGIIGVTVAGTDRPHSVPPGPHGGNLDINLLSVGATLYLPVQVPGAGVYLGDPHFAQGDGEVALTALEASLRCTVQLDVVPHDQAVAEFGTLVGPLAQTAEFLVPTGLDPDLDEAMRACVRQAVALLQARYHMDEHLAYAYLSAATDFNISQVVDLVCGVHARIRIADFAGLPR